MPTQSQPRIYNYAISAAFISNNLSCKNAYVQDIWRYVDLQITWKNYKCPWLKRSRGWALIHPSVLLSSAGGVWFTETGCPQEWVTVCFEITVGVQLKRILIISKGNPDQESKSSWCPCLLSASHVSYLRVMSPTYESCLLSTSHVSYLRVMSPIYKSASIYQSCLDVWWRHPGSRARDQEQCGGGGGNVRDMYK